MAGKDSNEGPGLPLGAKAPVMAPNGTDCSYYCQSDKGVSLR